MDNSDITLVLNSKLCELLKEKLDITPTKVIDFIKEILLTNSEYSKNKILQINEIPKQGPIKLTETKFGNLNDKYYDHEDKNNIVKGKTTYQYNNLQIEVIYYVIINSDFIDFGRTYSIIKGKIKDQIERVDYQIVIKDDYRISKDIPSDAQLKYHLLKDKGMCLKRER